ncbi:hypothetical protein [Tsukamurella strandjordii]|uniref:Uncharacterized protein n=1 Tax=Tsukamurella strandjordii TaxID=147577 RepID=A0AA90NL48_9ACTN|nr:hypothetical protein [Tsukamurella strandjordii]MDP0400391.1 hypothetical protein [Tsukamurella strandjordii]
MANSEEEGTLGSLSQGARGALAGIGAVGAVLLVGGFALRAKLDGDYNGCIDRYRDELNPYSFCTKQPGGTSFLMILGALILVGVLAAYLAMRSGKKRG